MQKIYFTLFYVNLIITLQLIKINNKGIDMKRKHATTDMTTGKPIVNIILFAIPLVLGTLFQQLYSFMDTVIVGRFIGIDALAAIGVTYSLHFLILGFVQGACVGFGIPLAQSFGAKDYSDMRRFLWNGTWLSIIISIILTGTMILLAEPLLTLIGTPKDILPLALIYIQVLFIGIPASVLYNYSASALRALGDSKRPFYFLLFSSFLNIVLDYIFIVPAGMGVFGAAVATVISQFVSGILNSWWLLTKIELLTINKEELAFSSSHIKRLCIIGLPMGLEYSISAIGAVVMQGAINGLGSVAVAAQTAGEKIRQMFTLPMESVGMAMATYVGQNYGAKRFDRIKQGIKSGLCIQLTYSIVAWVLLFVFKKYLVYIVLGETTSAVASGALQYLTLISTLFILHGSLMIFRNTIQGLGYSGQAIISGLGELFGRCLGGWLALHTFGFVAICYSNPLAWLFALCYCIVLLFFLLKKEMTLNNN